MNIAINLKSNTFVATNAQSYTGGHISGQVKKSGFAYPCIVSLHDRVSRNVIAQVETDLLGNYKFENLNKSFRFFVMATDPASQSNAVIQDNVVPK